MNWPHEQSFGIIPLQHANSQWQVLLICQRGCWGFPKGHPHEGESARQTAERELQEETGLMVSNFLSVAPLEEIYTFSKKREKIKKRVVYFLALVKGTLALQIDEIDNAIWYSFDRASQRLHHKTARHIWDQVSKQLAELNIL